MRNFPGFDEYFGFIAEWKISALGKVEEGIGLARNSFPKMKCLQDNSDDETSKPQ